MARRASNSPSRPRRFLRLDLFSNTLRRNWFWFYPDLFNYIFRIRWLQDVPGTLHSYYSSYIPDTSGSEAAGGLCKTSEGSVPGKALKVHTFQEFTVRAIVDCQNTCENDPRCASYNYYIPDKVCELNSQTKETRPDDFVTDELRFLWDERVRCILCL